MINILYVYAHPHVDSFNHLIKETGIQYLQETKNKVIVSDLYAQQFNPVASWNDFMLSETELKQQYFVSQKLAYEHNGLTDDINQEIQKLSQANHVIFQFPLWWFSMPAILKGWFDRVLVKGFAYDSGRIFNDGLLNGKTASLVVTTQSPEQAYQLDGIHGCSIDTIFHPIHHTLKFVGIKPLKPFVVYGAFEIDEEKKSNILSDYRQYLSSIDALIRSGN
jgi:NAD(P)H dehydrogenase (quinone)